MIFKIEIIDVVFTQNERTLFIESQKIKKSNFSKVAMQGTLGKVM